MEWVGLLIWVLVMTMAGAVAAGGGLAAPTLGLIPPFAIAGLASCVLFIVLDGQEWLAWVSAGAGVAGALVGLLGAATLTSDAPRGAASSQLLEENAAGVLGAVIPLLLTAAFCMVLAGVGVTTVG